MKRNKIIKLGELLCCFALFGSASLSLSYAHAEGEDETPEVPGPKEGFTRYEAEDAELYDCVAKGKVEDSPIDYGVYSGLGFVGSIDNDDATLVFTVSVSEAGSYPIYVGYAIDTGFANAGLKVYVNDTYFQTWKFTQKNGWGSFHLTAPLLYTINLSSGVNKIKFQHGYNYVEVDYIDIGQCLGEEIDPGENTSEIAQVPAGYTRYEAEKGDVTSGRVNTSFGNCSGTGFVGDLDFGTSKVTWKVTAPEKGEYNLRIAYAIGIGFQDASMKLYVNENLYSIVKFSEKNGWGVFDINAICESKISLLEGENIVSLGKSGEYAQIDFIDISNSKVGEWKESGYALSYPNLLEGYERHEAEEQYVILGECKGIGYYLDMGQYSGKGFVGTLDRDSYYIEFPMNVKEDGKYKIRVGYACFEAGASLRFYSGQYGRGGQCYFDNEQFAEEGHAHGWGMFMEDTIFETTISLKAGSKSYIMVRSGFTRCEIDYIDVGEKVGEYEQGTLDETMDRYNY